MTVNEQTLNEMLNADRPTLVMFYEPTDPRCQEEMPQFDEAVSMLDGQAHIAKIDATATPAIAAKYHVHNYPTFILFTDGQEAWRTIGRTPYAELKDMVKRFE